LDQKRAGGNQGGNFFRLPRISGTPNAGDQAGLAASSTGPASDGGKIGRDPAAFRFRALSGMGETRAVGKVTATLFAARGMPSAHMGAPGGFPCFLGPGQGNDRAFGTTTSAPEIGHDSGRPSGFPAGFGASGKFWRTLKQSRPKHRHFRPFFLDTKGTVRGFGLTSATRKLSGALPGFSKTFAY